MAFADLLITTALISRRADSTTDASADEGMGPTNDAGTYNPVMVSGTQLSVACRVTQQSARARGRSKQDEKDTSVSTLVIFTDYRQDLFVRDRFTIAGVSGDEQYESYDINDPGQMHHHIEWSVRRII